ncbi:hypothetical protein BgiMline_013408 [Biomphalaria glabrata]
MLKLKMVFKKDKKMGNAVPMNQSGTQQETENKENVSDCLECSFSHTSMNAASSFSHTSMNAASSFRHTSMNAASLL